MTIQAYFNQIRILLDRYSKVDVVLDVKVSFDLRPGDQGYISGSVTFKDASILYFREFLDEFGGNIEKIMYSYHYQDAKQALLFRYDNAAHKPALLFRDHKHLSAGEIEKAEIPGLRSVLDEIVSLKGWM